MNLKQILRIEELNLKIKRLKEAYNVGYQAQVSYGKELAARLNDALVLRGEISSPLRKDANPRIGVPKDFEKGLLRRAYNAGVYDGELIPFESYLNGNQQKALFQLLQEIYD